MKNIKIKSCCKINLSLKVLKKLNSGYHNITSLITVGVIGKFLRTGVVFNLGSGKATYNERK